MNGFRETSKVLMSGSKMTHLTDFGHNMNFPWQSKTFTFNPSRPNPRRREKIKLNFYFQTSLRYLKRFYEGTTRKCKNKNLT